MFGKEREGGRNDDILSGGNAFSRSREVGIHTCSGDYEKINLAKRKDSLKEILI